MTHAIVHLPADIAVGGTIPAESLPRLANEDGCTYVIPSRFFSSALLTTLTTHQVREPDDESQAAAER